MRSTLPARILTICFMVSLLAATSLAQVAELTNQTIWGSATFSDDLAAVQWSQDPRYFNETVGAEDGSSDLYQVDARSAERTIIVRGSDLVPPGQTEPLRIESYEFSNDGSKLLIFTNSVRVWRQNTKGEFYVWDLNQQTLAPVSRVAGLQQFAKFSPDGTQVGFVRANNIFVTNLASGYERQLTFDGEENVINGTSDWVYEEELGLRDAFRFSPDGTRVAFWRLDQTAIKPFYLIDELSLYPELTAVRYPKAGEANSHVQIGVVEIASGETKWVDLGADRDIYVAEMGFADSSTEVWLTRLNRHQNRLDLLLADVRSGKTRIVMSDTDDAWVDAGVPSWIGEGSQFLFSSERDGYAQVFLFNREGSLVHKVTPFDWDVTAVYGVDESSRRLYFSGAGEGALVRPLYSIGLDGRGLRRLSSADGTHSIEFNADYSLYVDTHSSASRPAVQTLREADGQLIRTIAENRQLTEQVEALDLNAPEFITVPVEDGVELNGYLIKPRDFDPQRQYPLLMYVYGGPGSQTVRDVWGGSRYLWHHLLVQQGYLVASVDNRGTGARGRDFKKATYLNLGRYEAADQIAAARYFGALPYVDESRIGIWGWSYGGYMSTLSMFKGGGTFKAALAVAPVTDWRLYDTIYTERYMRTPQENATGYEQGAPLAHVNGLTGNYLVVHGSGDDNVHVQNTIQLAHRLEEAGKQFDMRIYPNKTHSIAGGQTRVNLYEFFTMWLADNLQRTPAPARLP